MGGDLPCSVLGRPVRGRYRRPAAPGAIALVKAVGRDPRTWKDTGWVLGNSVLGLALGTIALGLVLLLPAIALNRRIASVHARLARSALQD